MSIEILASKREKWQKPSIFTLSSTFNVSFSTFNIRFFLLMLVSVQGFDPTSVFSSLKGREFAHSTPKEVMDVLTRLLSSYIKYGIDFENTSKM